MRAPAALDPDHARIDERSAADLVSFIQGAVHTPGFAEQLRFFEASGGEVREAGTWQPFAASETLDAADIAAFIEDPTRFSGNEARWLSRPHFALLLAFIHLYRHVRDQQNDLTRRHLDFYYKDVLEMEPLPAESDRVSILFSLASRVQELMLPANTALKAGKDSAGVDLVYRTERDILLNRAAVAGLRSVYVDRRITEIPDARRDVSLTASGAFDATLAIALGTPDAGDPVEAWCGEAIDTAFFVKLTAPLDFCRASLFLDPYELRDLMKLVRRRQSDDREWSEINRLMGLTNPANPRDFNANFESVVGPQDFNNDGLPQVQDVDDLYYHRTESDVRIYIDRELAEIGYDNFVALMPIKLRIDAEWAEINRTLERIGRRERGLSSWSLAPADPMAFDANLQTALGESWPPPWPSWPVWPGGIADIYAYDAMCRDLEAHICLTVERIRVLGDFAAALGDSADAASLDWSDVDALLTDAHAEQVYSARREDLNTVRGSDTSISGFDRVVTHVLNRGVLDPILAWTSARPRLSTYLDAGQLSVLDSFREQLTWDGASQVFSWNDVYRVLEFAQRQIEAWPEPVARKVDWRNLYAWEDATACLDDAANSPRWNTFGTVPEGDKDEPPPSNLGFGMRSPILALSQGTRTLTLTVGFSAENFDKDDLLRSFGLDPALLTPEELVAELGKVFLIDVTTEKERVEPEITAANIATGVPGDDYWTLLGVPRALDTDRPGLQLTLKVDATVAALAPIKGETTPILRLMLRPRWDDKERQWLTSPGAFETLNLAAVHLKVDVVGLVDLRLQQDDRRLDPRKPSEPFGSRPAVGSRLWLSHAELIQNRLERLQVDLSWMGLPASLAAHYKNYPGITGGPSFVARLSLLDRNLSLTLADPPLFDDDANKNTAASRSIALTSVAGTLNTARPDFAYVRRTDLSPSADLRQDSRAFCLELRPTDFGHPGYAALASAKAREQAVALANGDIKTTADIDAYTVNAPYTPTLQSMTVGYSATTGDLDPFAQNDIDAILHIHPFGESRVTASESTFFPYYESAGELYIGLSELSPPRPLALLLQLAEGTSDPDLPSGTVSWSILDGDDWNALSVLSDSTRGLLNTGIVELDLPVVSPGTRLPSGLTWLRAAIDRYPASVCDTVAIVAQAVFARLEERGNAADHYAQPLPPGAVTGFVQPNAQIASVAQPYTSFAGAPAEDPARLYVRVSERLHHRKRAISAWDYERLVLQEFSQIYKVKCLPAAGAGRVDVLVIPDIRDALPADALSPKAPANLLADIRAFLRERASEAADVRVRNARYVPVRVRLGVRFLDGEDEGYCRSRLNEDLVRFLSPWAYQEGEELMIGGKIYAASVVDFVDRRSYVDYVAQITLFLGDGAGNFTMIPVTDEDYHVATNAPDEVLVANAEHDIDIIPDVGYEQASFTGINFMKIELDFIVGA